MSLDEISTAIKQSGKRHEPTLIAIEGYGGSGKSTLAEKLKQHLPKAEVVKIDAFILKEPAQNAEPWEVVFDRKRLEKEVLEPAGQGQPVSYQVLDWSKNTLRQAITLPKTEYLIIDGISSYHPDIEHYYSFKLWVDTPIDVAKRRGELRDSDNENAKLWRKWAKCDLAYQSKYHPEQRADFVLANNKDKL